MNPENQLNNPQVNPDQAAAALALATRISEGLMPKQEQGQGVAPEGSEMPQEGPAAPTEAPEPQEDRISNLEAKMDSGFEELKQLIQKDDDGELSKLKEEIKALLDEPENE